MTDKRISLQLELITGGKRFVRQVPSPKQFKENYFKNGHFHKVFYECKLRA